MVRSMSTWSRARSHRSSGSATPERGKLLRRSALTNALAARIDTEAAAARTLRRDLAHEGVPVRKRRGEADVTLDPLVGDPDVVADSRRGAVIAPALDTGEAECRVATEAVGGLRTRSDDLQRRRRRGKRV